ncbi:hypothetical protein OQA88_11698 [Cercophora sp. LCS_1]
MGSPSPAPRPWRPKREQNLSSSKTATPGSAESQRRRPRSLKPGELKREDTPSSIDGISSQPRRSNGEGGGFEENLHRDTQKQSGSEDSAQRGSGMFSRSRLGMKISETARELVRKTSRNSLEGDSPSKPPRSPGSSSWLSRRLSSKKSNGSSQSPARGTVAPESKSSTEEQDEPEVEESEQPAALQSGHQSPEKGFAWQAEEDFTGHDLEFSTPAKTGRSNTKIDEIRALEVELGKTMIPDEPQPQPEYQSRNTFLDEIRALEIDTAAVLINAPPEAVAQGVAAQEGRGDKDDRSPRNWQGTATSPRVDEFRAREIERLSKRALATARLDEIRERHASEHSRSPSPELVRKPSKEPLRSLAPDADLSRAQERKDPAISQELLHPPVNEAVVIDASDAEKDPKGPGPHSNEGNEDEANKTEGSRARRDSRDLVRRLALVTSTSPIPEHHQTSDKSAGRGDTTKELTKQRKSDGAKGDGRPTVGFVGLKRDSSVESLTSKRSDLARSDIDPTERIEGEMQLFAPLENHSERGSLREHSPESDEDMRDVEETPRPVKIIVDPLTQPTPKVVGAFVDTPLTIKVEKSREVLEPSHGLPGQAGRHTSAAGLPEATTSASFRGRRASGSTRNSRSALSARGDRVNGRPSSVSSRRRARSLSRARMPLHNSVKPPTVRDDLLEIHQANKFDDSTLDDLADLLNDQPSDEGGPPSPKIKSEPGSKGLSHALEELETYDRMSKTLTTGLLGIRSARRGIERLEDEVLHAETKQAPPTGSEVPPPRVPKSKQESARPPSHGLPPGNGAVAYLQLPIPTLWSWQPRFRFTPLGLILFALSLWYLAESAMCYRYCKPVACYAGEPCHWSPDDPNWGYSIPVKADQWLTGGLGKTFVKEVGPEVSDWLADVWDAATGSDITQTDVSRLSWEQKQQYRRRLHKKGLVRTRAERPEDTAKFAAWRAAREASERAEGQMQMGYQMGGDESIGGDERL